MSHKSYKNFIGIDIGKFEFVVAVHGSKQVQSFENNASGWIIFGKKFKSEFKDSLVIVEATGGHELGLILFLRKLKIAVHRANARKVKSFIRSFGHLAKTDRLDALALARYGFERHPYLSLFETVKNALKLYEMAQRRRHLKKFLVQEKNRIQAPHIDELIQESCRVIIGVVEEQIKKIDQSLQYFIDQDPVLKERQKVLESIEGIGPITARDLICFMPELGTLNHKQVASLAGLAPHANESGIFKGQRRVKGGRSEVRTALFMAAMAARNSSSRFKVFYENLIARGKKPMVALTALMRKLIVVANARLKELEAENIPTST